MVHFVRNVFEEFSTGEDLFVCDEIVAEFADRCEEDWFDYLVLTENVLY